MALADEKLDVYRLAIGKVAWVYEKAGALEGGVRGNRENSTLRRAGDPFTGVRMLLAVSPQHGTKFSE